MKLSLLVILGFLAFTSANTDLNLFADVPEVQLIPYEPLPEALGLPSYVHEYFKNIIDQMNLVLSAFKAASSDNQLEVENAAQAVQMDAMSKIDEILRKVQDLMAKGGKVGACAGKEEDAIKEVTELVADGIKECAQDLIAALKDLTGGIMGQANDLIANINELKNTLKYCMDKGKVGQAFCYAANATKFIRLAKSIIGNAQDILAILQEQAGKLVAAAKNCNNNHIQVIYGKIKDIKSNVEVCVKNN